MKTPLARVSFEIEMARRELQGQRLEAELRRRAALREGERLAHEILEQGDE